MPYTTYSSYYRPKPSRLSSPVKNLLVLVGAIIFGMLISASLTFFSAPDASLSNHAVATPVVTR